MRIEQLVTAEPGWKAVFAEPDGSESVSRILGWAAAGDGHEAELVGVIVDPAAPSRIVAATEATSPDGGEFSRYRYVEPKAPPPPPPPPPPPAAAAAPAEPVTVQGAAEQAAKSFLKRKR